MNRAVGNGMKQKIAFISVYEKKDLEKIASFLEKSNYEIYAYGSSARELKKKNIDVYEIVDKSGIHLVITEAIKNGHYSYGNFYLKSPDIIISDLPEIIDEKIEFLGMENANLIRFAAQHYENILIISDISDYDAIMDKIKIFGEEIPIEIKKFYASKALNLLAYNEARLSRALFKNISLSERKIALPLEKFLTLKYGENSHQKAGIYSFDSGNKKGVFESSLIKGECLNLNHYLDLYLLNELLSSVNEPACAISKHCNLVAFSVSDKISSAFEKALKSDKMGSYAAICSFNRSIDEKTAINISEEYIECISAPDYQKSALDILKKKPDLKLIKTPVFISTAGNVNFFDLGTGFAIEEKDDTDIMSKYKIVTQRKPLMEEVRDLSYAALISKYSRAYSAVLFSENSTLAISGPQPSVYDAIKVLVEKLKYKSPVFESKKFVLATNGALNFKSISQLSYFNISAIIQPGNIVSDEECIEFCDKRNISMVLTHLRHFRHY